MNGNNAAYVSLELELDCLHTLWWFLSDSGRLLLAIADAEQDTEIELPAQHVWRGKGAYVGQTEV